MNADQTRAMEGISRGIIECWTRIKKKARDEGRGETNIEKHAPCITGALNAMEQFLAETDREDARVAAARGEV
jgi:hypothetical protein